MYYPVCHPQTQTHPTTAQTVTARPTRARVLTAFSTIVRQMTASPSTTRPDTALPIAARMLTAHLTTACPETVPVMKARHTTACALTARSTTVRHTRVQPVTVHPTRAHLVTTCPPTDRPSTVNVCLYYFFLNKWGFFVSFCFCFAFLEHFLSNALITFHKIVFHSLSQLLQIFSKGNPDHQPSEGSEMNTFMTIGFSKYYSKSVAWGYLHPN